MRIKLINKLNDHLNECKIKYFFLLKKSKNSHDGDIDVYINFKNFYHLRKLIKKFLDKNNFILHHIIQYEFNSYSFVICSRKKNNVKFFNLDICNYYIFNGKKIFSFTGLKSEKNLSLQKIKNLNNEDLFIYYLLKSFAKKKFDLNRFNYLKKEFLKLNFKRLEYFFGLKDFLKLKNIFLSSSNLKFKKEFNYFRLKYIMNKKTLFIKELIRNFKRACYPVGLCIGIIGVDGSGKSTIINQLVDKLSPKYDESAFKKILLYHLFNPKNNKSKNITPYNKQPYGIFLSFIKIIYLYIRFIHMYYFSILPNKIKGQLIIVDRNHYDVMIDPIRYRVGRFNVFLQFIFKFIPKPDFTIFLNVKPDLLFKRKKELKINQIKSLVKKYNSYTNKMHNIKKINNNINYDFSINKILDLILKNK